ncbi:MAG TPA: hypothetical protein VF149_01425 [Bacillales bacterium]
MAAEKKTSRKFGRPLVIIFIMLVVAIALFGAYMKWGGSGFDHWAADLPVVSSFVNDDKTKTGQRTEEIKQFEAKVQNQKQKIANLNQSLNGKEDQISRLQDQLSALQQRMKQQDKEESQQSDVQNQDVASVYGEMAPGSAAGILDKLDEDQAIDILSQLKPETAALIMGKMDKEKAANLTTLWAKGDQ